MTALFHDPSFWLTSFAIVVLVLLSAFFSVAETALTVSSQGKLKALADKGSLGATAAINATKDHERMVSAVSFGNAIVTILASALATALLVRVFGAGGVMIATLTLGVFVLVFAQVLPKTIAATYPESFATIAGPLALIVMWILSPVIRLVRMLVQLALGLFGVQADPYRKILALQEEIAGAISLGHSEGAVEKEARNRLLGALDLGQRTVEEIMRHRRQIEMIDADNSPDEIITQVLASAHTRLPIFRDNEENIIGVIHAKDLLREVDRLMRGEEARAAGLAELDIVKIAMKPYFIPDSTPLDEQMREFLKRRTHFALVVDEYSALRGLITLEDILEEIVGEISDEFDPVSRENLLKPDVDGSLSVDGAMTIRDLNRATDWRLPDDEANTIAGLVIHEAQMIPVEGQVFSFHGFRFEVVQRRENRVTRLKIRPLN